MVIKKHLSGCAIAYEPRAFKKHEIPLPGRPQGSLEGQQKRAICDAVEWMRLYGCNKPLFFVVTSPGKGTAHLHDEKIKTFTKKFEIYL